MHRLNTQQQVHRQVLGALWDCAQHGKVSDACKIARAHNCDIYDAAALCITGGGDARVAACCSPTRIAGGAPIAQHHGGGGKHV
jgi:hypothetical protein